MAIDTYEKLRSMMGLGTPGLELPVADGSFDQGDRQHFMGLYSGILLIEVSFNMARIIKITAEGELRFIDTADRVLSVKCPSGMSASFDLELPDADGSTGQFLKTDGAGKLSWADPGEAVSLQEAYDIAEDIVMTAGNDITLTQANNERMLTLNKTGLGVGDLLWLFNAGTGACLDIDCGQGIAVDIDQIYNYGIADLYKSATGAGDLVALRNDGTGIALQFTSGANPTYDVAGTSAAWSVRKGGGALFAGLCLPPTSKTVASDAITVTADNCYITLNGEGAAADDVATISGGTNGQVLILSKGNDNITIKNGTGNIYCGADRLLNSVHDIAVLVYNASYWKLISYFDNN